MSQTVIGFFKDHSEAQKALAELQSKGVSRDHIDNSSGASGAHTRTSGSPDINPVSGSERDENSVRRTGDDRTVDAEGRNTNRFTDFFNNLFGSADHDDAKRYRHVAERTGAMVTVHARSDEEAEAAADVLDACGAVDVDEHASGSGFSGADAIRDRSSTAGASRNDSMGGSLNSGSQSTRSRIFSRQVNEQDRLRGSDEGIGSREL